MNKQSYLLCCPNRWQKYVVRSLQWYPMIIFVSNVCVCCASDFFDWSMSSSGVVHRHGCWHCVVRVERDEWRVSIEVVPVSNSQFVPVLIFHLLIPYIRTDALRKIWQNRTENTKATTSTAAAARLIIDNIIQLCYIYHQSSSKSIVHPLRYTYI